MRRLARGRLVLLPFCVTNSFEMTFMECDGQPIGQNIGLAPRRIRMSPGYARNAVISKTFYVRGDAIRRIRDSRDGMFAASLAIKWVVSQELGATN